MVSRLLLPTYTPCSDSLSLRLPTSRPLTSPEKVTRRFIMQKARRHRKNTAPTACRHMVSGTISLFCSKCFSPFPHGTGSLSVSREYLALPDGPGRFTQGYSCPALLRIPLGRKTTSCKGLSPAMAGLSRPFHSPSHIPLAWSYNPTCAVTPVVWATPRSLAATGGIILIFFSCRY